MLEAIGLMLAVFVGVSLALWAATTVCDDDDWRRK